MRLDFVKTFLESTTHTLREVVDPDAHIGAIRMRPAPVAFGEVVAVINLTGDAQGKVIFDLDLLTAVQVAGQMMEEDSSGLSLIGRSAIAELASMATGKAISEINDSGVALRMAPPTVLSGVSNKSYDDYLETLVAPIATSYGEIRVNVTIQDLE